MTKGGMCMKRIGEGILRGIPLLLCVALLFAMIHAVPSAYWRSIGKGAAVLLMGMQDPKGSVAYAREVLEKRETATMPTVPSLPSEGVVPTVSEPIIPPKGDGGGAVSEEQIGGGVAITDAVSVKNNSGMDYDFRALLEAGLPFENAATEEPQVLIVHTHTTECYMSYYAGYYNADDATRTTDTTQNVAAVGDAIAEELRAKGVGVLHDVTLHDSPQYSGAYSRSEDTIKAYLEKYPSIRVVLDIHRDAMMYDDLTKVKPTATVDGQKAAQVMLVVGGTSTDDLPNAYCEDNLRFGLQLQHALATAYPDLARPLYVVDARYNQGLLSGSLLIEVGTDANTLSEALYSGRLVGRQLAAVLQ